MWDEPKYIVPYVGVIVLWLVSNGDVPLRARLALLLKHADRTLQHKPLSTTEGQWR